MEIFEFNILSLFTFTNLAVIIFGTLVGLLVGALPGLGSAVAIALLLPVTFNMEPLPSILMLLAVYQAGEYGGSISAITLNIPGTQSAVATTLDGNVLARKSYPGKALGYSLLASSIGGLFGGLVLLFFTLPLSEFAKKMASPEYFLISILALLAVVTLSSKNITKGLISIILGLMAGTVGIDLLSGVSRVTLGFPELMGGISIIVMVIALFAFSEIYSMISRNMHEGYITNNSKLSTGLNKKEIKKIIKPSILGSIIGSIVGIIPGLGSGASSWMAYISAKKTSKSPETFGEGNPEGIAAPESANNSTVGSALIPLLALGIPGSPTIAIIMGAFIIQGIQPGPKVFSGEMDLVNGIFYGFLLTTFAMYILGRLITPLFAKSLAFPNSIIVPIILILSIVGVYASHELFFHIWLVLILGIISYILKEIDFSLPSILLAFVLGPIIEENLRRSMIISDGSYSIFFTRGYSISILLIIIFILIFSVFSWYKSKKRNF